MDPKRIRALGMILLLFFGGSVLFAVSKNHIKSDYKEVSSFEECVEAGYSVHEGSPPMCITVEGESFMKNQN